MSKTAGQLLIELMQARKQGLPTEDIHKQFIEASKKQLGADDVSLTSTKKD